MITQSASDLDVRLNALRRLPALRAVTPGRARRLVRQFDELEVEAGTLLAHRGRPATELLVVLDGCLEACGESGRRRLGPGSSWGWEGMAARGENPETVMAATRARLLVMGRAQFRALDPV